MIFSTYIFTFVFLPIVLLLYFGMSRFVSRKVQHIFIILASLVFYGYNHVSYVWLILISVAVNYITATGTQNITNRFWRKASFVTGVVFNVCLLGYYKYYNFFVDNINTVFDTHFVLRYIILPLGISFFTFQQIAFLISVNKKEEKVPGIIDYTLFITFFPQLVAGPIVFSQDVMSQYQDDKNRFFNADNFAQGLFIFIIGLFKKAVIADTLNIFTSNTFFDPHALTFGSAWLGSLAYTFQLFFDFSGYSDMAIGLAKMMNINLPVNFYSPYRSKSITEFWKRWHITLGRSLFVLIYIPLGGNRKGLTRTCINLFAVFFVSGLWHGAAWTFVIWGSLHGVVRVFEKLADKQLEKIPDLIRIFFTFLFVSSALVLFRSQTVADALVMLKTMYLPDTISFDRISHLAFNTSLSYPDIIQTIFVVGVLAVVAYLVFLFPKNSIDLYNDFKPKPKVAAISAVLFAISVIHFSKVGAFIYFNF
ncbi:MBOAT family protein [Prevotella sp. 10(H)]|uniref:MBOAT family O-acyltransferase n=1 Tax=Prevotella sp. 10(H) TaxID=1158294 RepID=UPI0004A6C8D9|nr:MBOAT family O-acyltransferase [Prevotella sp. 10(H)]